MNVILTIGREYGSGGRYIGQKVAEKLNIPFYDKELIMKVHEKGGFDYHKLETYDEVKKNAWTKALDILSITRQEDAYDSDTYQVIMEETIKDLAATHSCVILGRNSNKILSECPNVLKIFIYSKDLNFKIQRKMQLENMNSEETLKKLKDIDKKRKEYYEYYNKNSKWGTKNDYDFCLDSSILGIDKTIDLIVYIYKNFQDNLKK